MQKTKEILLHRYQGKAVSLVATARIATVADHAAFVAMQAAVQQAMPDKSLYVPSTSQELLLDLQTSLCIGVWVRQEALQALASQDVASSVEQVQGETLIAYATMRYDGDSAHNYANYFDLPAQEIPLWANFDSALVLADYRGNHLQQQLGALCIAWRRPDIIGIGCTVSPENVHSLANVKSLGFTVHSRRVMYGKHDRYLMQKRLAPLPGKYRHFKGGEYRVLDVATHSETLAPMVVYQALYAEGGIWVRPAELWSQWVSREAYEGPRFIFIEP